VGPARFEVGTTIVKDLDRSGARRPPCVVLAAAAGGMEGWRRGRRRVHPSLSLAQASRQEIKLRALPRIAKYFLSEPEGSLTSDKHPLGHGRMIYNNVRRGNNLSWTCALPYLGKCRGLEAALRTDTLSNQLTLEAILLFESHDPRSYLLPVGKRG
jgi:hypothetical protein